ncbi:MAG: aminoacetone oxidase family FAD-binding enzyme [Anaerolineae bacterium]|nr:aminoacetone oxidase family FAD-binding enzyme [Anaerolineae bacterium]
MARVTIGIVGAGPAGIMAALEARRLGAQVLIFDTNAMVGRKLTVTGNGRCNISNLNVRADRYLCADPRFVEIALARYDQHTTLGRLEELGILTYATSDGWCYPLSNSAATVADTLAAALDVAGVDVHLKTKISGIEPGRGQLTLVAGGPEHSYSVDRAIVATGGKAYPALGSNGNFFAVLAHLGHTIAPVEPALVPIVADMRPLHKLQGVRMDVGLKVFAGNQLLGESVGNALFTDTGLSGPAAMDLSHLVSTHLGEELTLCLDLIGEHRDALEALLERMRREPIPLRVLLGAVMPAKAPPVAIGLGGLSPEVRMDQLAPEELAALLEQLSDIRLRVRGTRGFQHAQLSTGGVPVTEVDPVGMASRKVPGLHLAGEVLDVIGPCGGYNLQFAFTSGALAGVGAASDL